MNEARNRTCGCHAEMPVVFGQWRMASLHWRVETRPTRLPRAPRCAAKANRTATTHAPAAAERNTRNAAAREGKDLRYPADVAYCEDHQTATTSSTPIGRCLGASSAATDGCDSNEAAGAGLDLKRTSKKKTRLRSKAQWVFTGFGRNLRKIPILHRHVRSVRTIPSISKRTS